MKNNKYIPALTTVFLILLLWLWAPAVWIKGIFSFFVLLALLVYYTLYRPDESKKLKLAQWYYIALAVQCLHFIEEYLGKFYIRFPELFNLSPMGKDDFVIFNLLAYGLFVLGGIAIFKNYKSLMLIPILFILLGILANAINHVLLAFWSGGYFPGLYTALLYWILGPILWKLLRSESKQAKI